MSKKSKKRPVQPKPPKPERAETEAKFPSHLHPIIECKRSVLSRARLETYGGLAFSAVVWVLPVSGVTRSLILLFALAPLIDAAWRSPWSHAWQRPSKVRATIALVGMYLAIAVSMILNDHSSTGTAVRTYLVEHLGGSVRWLYVLAGAVGYYLWTKLFSLIKAYRRNRRAEQLAQRQKVMESRPGWLDYRLDSQESSRRLHSLVARMGRVIRWMGLMFTHKSWFIGKEEKGLPIVRTQAKSWLAAYVLNTCSERLEPDLEELQSNANLFISSTEGYLGMAAKQGDIQVAGLYEYFQAQQKDIREIANVLSEFPPTFRQVRGTSRELNAALDRSLTIWRTHVEVLRKLEGHCARMVRLTRAGFERAIEKPVKKLASTLIRTVETLAEHENDDVLKEKARELRSLARSGGINVQENRRERQ